MSEQPDEQTALDQQAAFEAEQAMLSDAIRQAQIVHLTQRTVELGAEVIRLQRELDDARAATAAIARHEASEAAPETA